MIRVILNLILLLAIANLSNAQNNNNVKIKEISGENECRICYGKLIITNGHKTDTIFGGQWGYVPNYEVKEIKDTKFLILDNDYSFPGGTNIKIVKILSLDNNHFLKEVLKKEITLYRESHLNENNNPTNFIYENNPVIRIADTIKIVNNITFEKCPETDEEDMCKTLLKIEDTEHLSLVDLLKK